MQDRCAGCVGPPCQAVIGDISLSGGFQAHLLISLPCMSHLSEPHTGFICVHDLVAFRIGEGLYAARLFFPQERHNPQLHKTVG